jgi:hypothetical protein
MVYLEEIMGNLLNFDSLKMLVIILALVIGVSCFLCKFLCKYVFKNLSKENSRRLTYAIRIPAVCLIVIPIIDIMMGTELSIFMIGVVISGIILLVISSKSTIGDFISMVLSGF